MARVYQCINCGAPNESLFKVFAPNATTLQNCKKCCEVIDKYVEYDLTTVFIDVLLMKTSAFRHILFNTDEKAYLQRLVTLTILSSAYVDWVFKKQNHAGLTEGPVFYELELEYYIVCLQHALGVAVFVCSFLIFAYLTTRSFSAIPSYFSYKRVVEGISLSYCWNLAVIPSLAWSHYSIFSLLSQVSIFVGCIHTFRVCVRPDFVISAISVMCAYIMQWSVSSWMTSIHSPLK